MSPKGKFTLFQENFNMERLKYCSLLLLIFSSLVVRAQEDQFTSATDWASLVAKAGKEKKLILVDSYFQGCHPCKQMDDEVFPLEPVMKLMKDNFISTKIDFLKEDLGKQLQLKYAVTGFPTFLILNSDGKLLSRFSGYQEADKFQAQLKEAIKKAEKGQLLSGFSTSLDVDYPAFYVAAIKERKPFSPQDLLTYLKDKNINEEKNAVPFLFNRSVVQGVADILLPNYNSLEKLYGRELLWSKRIACLAAKLKTDIPVRDDAKFKAFLSEIRSSFSAEDWPYGKLDLAEEYYYKQFKDRKTFFKFAGENFNNDENKLRYMSLYLSEGTVDADERKLYAEWLQKVLKEDSSYEILAAGTKVMLAQKDTEKAKLYARWGVNKAKVVNKSPEYFEGVLK